jgi:NADH-quinone oxidoreductase subunit B
MLIDAILKLHEKVMAEPLGDRRRRTIEAKAARGDGPRVAPGSMPSSYRFDKARRTEWEKAVAEGREEQLRIENWMEAGIHVKGGNTHE